VRWCKLIKALGRLSSAEFEEILAAEEPLIVSEPDEHRLDSQGLAIQVVKLGQVSRVSKPTQFLIPTLLSPSYDLNPTDQQAAAQDSHYVETLRNAKATSEIQSRRSAPTLHGTKSYGLVRTHAKRDLTETEISCVAQSLIQGKGESIDFFLTSCQLICKGWISLPIGNALLTSTDPDELAVAAFDVLDNLRYYQGATRLLKQFAYVYLIQAINMYKAATRKDRCHSCTPREPGHGDTTIAIDAYLSAKGTNGLSRAQLLEHIRKGTRWYTLARPHLIILSLYTTSDKTIIYIFRLNYSYNILKTCLP
jgi:hypothetical protein